MPIQHTTQRINPRSQKLIQLTVRIFFFPFHKCPPYLEAISSICDQRLWCDETRLFFFNLWSGVRLSLLGMLATGGPIIQAPADMNVEQLVE
jgi:hypothetical protein